MPEMGELLREGVVRDPFFETVNDGEWNACIGKQGDEINYVEGYMEAAQLLADTLIAKKLYGSRDTLAMPILYNARHGLELALKYILRELVAIGMAREREGPINHDIEGYWEHLSAQVIGDLACRTHIAELKPFVESFTRHDIDGQELRYFENQEGKQSLEQLAVVNLHFVQASIVELRDILGRLMDRVFRLSQEVVAGNSTKDCSRSDLIEIAGIVGAKSTWTEEAFIARRAATMERFDLSSNGFSNALTAIKASREIKVLIGLDTEFSHLTSDKIMEIAEIWLKVHPPVHSDEKPRVVNAASASFDEIMRYGDDMRELNGAVLKMLSIEEFAELQTIFYIGRDGLFGDQYARLLDQTLTSHHRTENRIALVHHILSKSNFIAGLVAGLRKVGQPKLAVALAELRDAARPEA